MKDYVFYVYVSGGSMGSRGDYDRRVIPCENDEAARDKMREINKNWAIVLFCFPAECEVTLKNNPPKESV